MELARVLKCQDLSPTRGMATVFEESDTHLNAGYVPIFQDAYAHSTPSQEASAPCTWG